MIDYNQPLLAALQTMPPRTLRIYTDPRPANPDTSVVDSVLLAVIALKSAKRPSSSEVAFRYKPTTWLASGRAKWGRVFDESDVAMIDLSVGDLTRPGEIRFVSADVTEGEPVPDIGLSISVGPEHPGYDLPRPRGEILDAAAREPPA